MYDKKKFFDIKHPGQKSPTPRIVWVPAEIPYVSIDRPISPPKPNLKIPLIATAFIFLAVIGIFGLNLLRFKEKATASAPVIYDQLKKGTGSLFKFELGTAKESFQNVAEELKKLNSQSPIQTLPAILANLFKLSQDAVFLSGTLEELKTNGLALLINKKGAFLIEDFQRVKGTLAEINDLSRDLKTRASNSGYKLGNEFSDMNTKLTEADKFLASLINWLETPKKQRLLIFFQNPSEIRPTGGFIGSYGHATFFHGNLLSLEVRDIYDPDGQLDIKVVPPKPLQGITDKWGARDANWFFDFPTSAQKVIDFLEASKIYEEQGIKFSGAVAVNVGVIRDILEVIGPISLPDYKVAIDGDNFLKEIQKEVESGKDKAQGEPKRILKILTPIVFEKLASINPQQKEVLVKKLTARFNQKDIMVYFKDPAIEDYLKKLGVAGEVLNLPEDFRGEYLAVVNANVAGGKSDALVTQNIKFNSRIDSSGRAKNQLVIERSHGGKNEKDWWYRATNKNYIQIFTTPGSRLLKIAGVTKKTIKPLVNYENKNYLVDDALKNLENAGALVFGKTLFSSWFDVKAGAKQKLELDYISPNQISPNEGSYQFVFEKQSGVNSGLDFSIEAPPGYHWQESQSPTFNYSGQDLPARIFLNLTLEANQR